MSRLVCSIDVVLAQNVTWELRRSSCHGVRSSECGIYRADDGGLAEFPCSPFGTCKAELVEYFVPNAKNRSMASISRFRSGTVRHKRIMVERGSISLVDTQSWNSARHNVITILFFLKFRLYYPVAHREAGAVKNSSHAQ